MELGGPEIAPVVTFPPSLPSRSQRYLSAWLFWKAICNGWSRRCAGDRSATIAIISKQTKVCRRSRLHLMGDAGWEDRFSDPGRPKAASRRGEAPRGGASPLRILLKEESLSKLSRSESGFFYRESGVCESARWVIPRDSVCETTKGGWVKPRRQGGRYHDAASRSGATYPHPKAPIRRIMAFRVADMAALANRWNQAGG